MTLHITCSSQRVTSRKLVYFCGKDFIMWTLSTSLCRLPEETLAWKDESGGAIACKAPTPPAVSAPHAWLNRVTQEEGRRRSVMEEEEEGRKGMGPVEDKADESQNKRDMQEKLNKLFNQPADPWATTGRCLE